MEALLTAQLAETDFRTTPDRSSNTNSCSVMVDPVSFGLPQDARSPSSIGRRDKSSTAEGGSGASVVVGVAAVVGATVDAGAAVDPERRVVVA
jgi:hypothetical protein